MSRKRKKKRSASVGEGHGEAVDDSPLPTVFYGVDGSSQCATSGVSEQAIEILSMIAEGFTYNQIVNRMDVTPRDIFDAAEEVLDALGHGDVAGRDAIEGLEDDLPF